jgi:hypothetical protein
MRTSDYGASLKRTTGIEPATLSVGSASNPALANRVPLNQAERLRTAGLWWLLARDWRAASRREAKRSSADDDPSAETHGR